MRPHIPSARFDQLRQIPLFAGCNKAQLTKISSLVDEAHVEAGTVLARQGGLGRQSFVISSGTVEALVDCQVVDRFGPGDFVGETAVLRYATNSATLVTASPSILLVIAIPSLYELLTTGGVGIKIIEELTRRLQAAQVVNATMALAVESRLPRSSLLSA